MARREVDALRAAVEAAKKVIRKPVIDTGSPEPEAPAQNSGPSGQSQ